jgi:hypothetical protein
VGCGQLVYTKEGRILDIEGLERLLRTRAG